MCQIHKIIHASNAQLIVIYAQVILIALSVLILGI